MNLHEIKLFEPVKRYLDDMGYKVHCEVPELQRVVDIVAFKESLVISVELKVGFCKKALRQAYINCLFADKSYIAIKRRPRPENILSCQKSHIGILIVVGMNVEVLSEAVENNPSEYYKKRAIESCKHSECNNIAGLPCQKGIGPAIDVSKSVEKYIQQNPNAKWKQIFSAVPNHYASPSSMKQSLEKHRHFEYLKEKYKDNKCEECHRQKTGSCPKGNNRKNTSKACINFWCVK
jgi:hypothetical protein